ncbi:MAG: hypothetical protein A2039_06435 [Candidatus Melainabacteria bacterium GWA2_34_9]|nr:MAG: hypothetical protein A2039_06435 [Candidatus Melainabacteria bacterium GWA2_34_9]
MKKNLLILNSSLQINSAHNEMGASDPTIVDDATLAAWFITGSASGTTPTNLVVLQWTPGDNSVWLTDSTRLSFFDTGGGTGCATQSANSFDPTAPDACYVIVDTNGDKKPNAIATNAGVGAADVWILGITPNSIIPVILSAATTTVAALTDVNGNAMVPPYTQIGNGNRASYSVMTTGNT